MGRISDVLKELSVIGAVDKPAPAVESPVKFAPPQEDVAPEDMEEVVEVSPEVDLEEPPESLEETIDIPPVEDDLNLEGLGIDTSGYTLSDEEDFQEPAQMNGVSRRPPSSPLIENAEAEPTLDDMLMAVMDKLALLDTMLTDTQRDVVEIIERFRKRN